MRRRIWLCLGIAILSGCRGKIGNLFPPYAFAVDPGGTGAGGEGGEPEAGGTGGAAEAGGGSLPECMTAADCGNATACASPQCNAGVCSMHFVPAGRATAQQTAGDCMTVRCDGAGNAVSQPNPTDIPPDASNPCSSAVCDGGAPTQVALAAGTACPSGVCDGAGACVECVVGAGCPSGVCAAGACQAPTCSDGVKNGDETGVDCGGGCAGCANGAVCGGDGDCASGTCAAGVCACGTSHVMIAEVQTSAPGDRRVEFIELLNPSDSPITLVNLSVITQIASVYYSAPSLTIAPHARFVIGGAKFTGAVDARAIDGSEINDDGSVQLLAGATTVDAVCYYDPAQWPEWTPFPWCEGAPMTRRDAFWQLQSIARRPAGYNCQDTGENAVDFYVTTSPTPGAP